MASATSAVSGSAERADPGPPLSGLLSRPARDSLSGMEYWGLLFLVVLIPALFAAFGKMIDKRKRAHSPLDTPNKYEGPPIA